MFYHPCRLGTNHQSHNRWAENEFATLVVKDKRRVRRLKIMAANLHAHPGSSIPEACGTWASSKASYRLVENGKITTQEVMKSHGLFLHSSLCVGAHDGKVFGLLEDTVWAREADPTQPKVAGARNRKPIEEKESHRWLEGWRKADALFHQLDGRRQVVSVADREGDIYEVFALCLQKKTETGGGADLLIRAQHNRQCTGGEKADESWDHVEGSAAVTQIKIKVPRSPGKKERIATLEVRYGQVELAAPAHKTKYLGLDRPLDLCLVIATEVASPAGVEPICWRLWTTVEISNSQSAAELIGWYAKRWLIEEFHRILKSGCKVEDLQLESLQKIHFVLSLNMIIACYLLGLTKAAREHPNNPVSAWLDEDQWKALYCYTFQTTNSPKKPPSLGNVVTWIACLGGFLNRASDGSPGAQVLWRGLRRLQDITTTYNIFNSKICG